MSDDEVKFIPYELALKVVGNVVEEEHLHEMNRRILTVYDKHGKEICWYDAEEILAEVTGPDEESIKKAAVELIMHKIPEWALDDLLDSFKKNKA